MKSYTDRSDPHVILVGHGGSGKTTLAEALLARAGAINRIGRVEDGTTSSDTEPEEQKRRISISLAVLPFEWAGHKVNLIDTPGYADFVGDVEAALRIADLAVFVVSAVEGLEVQAEVVWRRCAELDIPRMVFVNKLDRSGPTSSGRSTSSGARSAPASPRSNCRSARKRVFGASPTCSPTPPSSTPPTAPTPPRKSPRIWPSWSNQVHDNLVEGIVVADDELMERYLEGDVPSVAELEHTLAHGVAGATVFPVVCGSALTGVGVDRLADLLCEIGPSPVDRPPVAVRAGDTEAELKPDPSAQPLAFVFKTIADPYVGQLSLFKVLSGTIKTDDQLVNPASGTTERLHGLFLLRARTRHPSPRWSPVTWQRWPSWPPRNTGATPWPQRERRSRWRPSHRRRACSASP